MNPKLGVLKLDIKYIRFFGKDQILSLSHMLNKSRLLKTGAPFILLPIVDNTIEPWNISVLSTLLNTSKIDICVVL